MEDRPGPHKLPYEIKACCLFSNHLIWEHLGLTESYHLHSAGSQCFNTFFKLHRSMLVMAQFSTPLFLSPTGTSQNTQDNRKRIFYPHISTHVPRTREHLDQQQPELLEIEFSQKSKWNSQTWLIQNTLQTIFIQIKKTQVNKVMVHTCYKPG